MSVLIARSMPEACTEKHAKRLERPLFFESVVGSSRIRSQSRQPTNLIHAGGGNGLAQSLLSGRQGTLLHHAANVADSLQQLGIHLHSSQSAYKVIKVN